MPKCNVKTQEHCDAKDLTWGVLMEGFGKLALWAVAGAESQIQLDE